jgi:hypothetical protein
MKTIKICVAIYTLTAIGLISCGPIEDRKDMGPSLPASSLKFSVTQQAGFDNKVFLKNETPGSIAYWDYVLNTTTKNQDTVVFPFPGDYWIKFTAYTSSGPSVKDSVKITVTSLCNSCFKSNMLRALTNLAGGRTWTFNLSDPMGFYGPGYVTHTGDGNDWNWWPGSCQSWSDFGCGTYWGKMTFDLSTGYNYTVTQHTSPTDSITTRGSFVLDSVNSVLKFVNAKVLYSNITYNNGTYADLNNVHIFQLTNTNLDLGITNVASRGSNYRYNYIPKN